MCGRYALYGPWPSLPIQEGVDFDALLQPLADWQRYNQAPGQMLPVVRRGESGACLEHRVWGLVPSWIDARRAPFSAINARAETLMDKPAFRESWRLGQRCLVPARGWYEWPQAGMPAGLGGVVYFSPPASASPLLMFAGLWAETRVDGEVFGTYTIITTEARGVVRDVHDRQPRVLAPHEWTAWLNASRSDATRWLAAVETPLQWHEVDRRVGKVAADDAQLVAPIPATARAPVIRDLF